jgi:hypothetical protein
MDKTIYRDVFDLHADSLKRLDEPDFWDNVFWPAADALAEKHQHNVFFIEMMLAVHGELERVWRKRCMRNS